MRICGICDIVYGRCGDARFGRSDLRGCGAFGLLQALQMLHAQERRCGKSEHERGGDADRPDAMAWAACSARWLAPGRHRLARQLLRHFGPGVRGRRERRQGAQRLGQGNRRGCVQFASAAGLSSIGHDIVPFDNAVDSRGSSSSRRRAVPRATWDLEKLAVLPSCSAISWCA